MDAEEKIFDLLTKLIDHEKSARTIGNLKEAEAFADKIQTLLSKHKLEMSEIELFKRGKEDISDTVVIPEELGLKNEAMRIAWQFDLAGGIAHSNNCTLLGSRSTNYLFFVGRRSDREICVALFKHLAHLALHLADKAAQERSKQADQTRIVPVDFMGVDYASGDTISVFDILSRMHGLGAGAASLSPEDYKRAFCLGFAKAIVERLMARWYSAKAEAEAKASKGTATKSGLMILKQIERDQERISDFIRKEYPNVGDNKPEDPMNSDVGRRPFHMQGFMDGKHTGLGVALTPNVLKPKK